MATKWIEKVEPVIALPANAADWTPELTDAVLERLNPDALRAIVAASLKAQEAASEKEGAA